MSPNEPVPEQGRVFGALAGTLTARALTARRAALVIAVVTVVLTIASGIAIWLVDQSFSSLGEGLWWAVQTLTTVGYGDVVPDSTAGRLIATLVMLNGIALLTVVTAAVTAMLIDQARTAHVRHEPEEQAIDPAVAQALDDISSRLAAIEVSMSASRQDRR